MRYSTQSLVLAVLGVVLLKLAVGGAYLRYVNGRMHWPLVVTAVLLLLLAGTRPERSSSAPGAVWLLLVPAFVALTISPMPLGASVAERNANSFVPSTPAGLAPLPPGSPAELRVQDLVFRAEVAPSSLADRLVAVTGFVSTDASGGWYVTRISITCCTADALAYRVLVAGSPSPPRNSWVEVTGRYTAAHKGVIALDSVDVRPIAQPSHPYQ